MSRRMARKVGIAVAGSAVLLLGVVMIVLPGPAVVVIPLGLTILAKEFPWARRLMSWLQAAVNQRLGDLRRWTGKTSGLVSTLSRRHAALVASAARSVALVSRSLSSRLHLPFG